MGFLGFFVEFSESALRSGFGLYHFLSFFGGGHWTVCLRFFLSLVSGDILANGSRVPSGMCNVLHVSVFGLLLGLRWEFVSWRSLAGHTMFAFLVSLFCGVLGDSAIGRYEDRIGTYFYGPCLPGVCCMVFGLCCLCLEWVFFFIFIPPLLLTHSLRLRFLHPHALSTLYPHLSLSFTICLFFLCRPYSPCSLLFAFTYLWSFSTVYSGLFLFYCCCFSLSCIGLGFCVV